MDVGKTSRIWLGEGWGGGGLKYNLTGGKEQKCETVPLVQMEGLEREARGESRGQTGMSLMD